MGNDRNFTDIRYEKGFTQQSLADKAGISMETISKIERGETQRPKNFVVEALAKTLSVSNSELRASISQQYIHRNIIRDKKLDNNDYNTQYKICEQLFQALALVNSKCDIEIFHQLFWDNVPPNMTIESLRGCIRTVRANIVHVLNAVVDLFEAMTGENCAASLHVRNNSAESTTLTVVERDYYSNNSRSGNEQIIVDKHSIFERIFLKNEFRVIVPNIAEGIKSGSLRVTSPDAGKLFNAAFVVPIPDVRPDSELSGNEVWACLYIESTHALRSDRIEVVTHFAQELAFRLGAMQYRLHNLTSQYLKLKKARV